MLSREDSLDFVRSLVYAGSLALLGLSYVERAAAAEPTVEQALKLMPIQRDVDFDRPTAADVTKCRIKSEKGAGVGGWIVVGPSGHVLRRFLDTNADGVVDQWCYFKDGIEVYRDIDANFNRKADQYRWLNTAGTRWGMDSKEAGVIDGWKSISAEEVTQEIVAALRASDAARFTRLLATADDLTSLGLAPAKEKEIAGKLRAAPSAFEERARQQKTIGEKTKWLHFGGHQPGIVPAGTDGATEDVVVYENVIATVENDGKHAQVYVGTLIQVGQAWKAIDAPQVLTGKSGELAQGGVFFRLPSSSGADQPGVAAELDENIKKVVSELEKLDKALSTASGAEQLARLHARRAELLVQLANGAKDKTERGQWIKQLADTVSMAVQSGAYPDGVQQLKTVQEKLQKDEEESELVSYVTYRYLTAQHDRNVQTPDADFGKIQTTWVEDLKKFVADYPKAADTADAMLQVAMAQEFAGQETEAKTWYGKVVEEYPTSATAKKAAGAKRRLESVGKTMPLRAASVNSKPIDLAAMGGYIVVVHYWATWCEPCKSDIKQLKELQGKYGRQGLVMVGVNFDNNRNALVNHLKQDPIPWPQLFEEGGLDSRLANEMGILNLPTMILVDRQGKVANRGVHISELEGELKKLLERQPAKKPAS